MNIDKSVFGVLSILVAVIVVATVAIPIVDDSAKEIQTSQNNTTEKFMMASKTSEDITIEGTTENNTFLINGESKTFAEGEYEDTWMIIMNNAIIRLSSSGSWLYCEGLNGPSGSLGPTGHVTITKEGNWEIVSTIWDSAGSYSGTYDWICYPSENGDYGFYNYNSATAYVDNDSTIFAVKVYRNSDSDGNTIIPGIIWSGSISGGTEYLYAWDSKNTPPTDVSADTTAEIRYNELGAISTNITAVYETYKGNEGSLGIAIIPNEYHIITNNDSAMISLLQIIPLLLLIVPVMMAVRMYSSRGE